MSKNVKLSNPDISLSGTIGLPPTWTTPNFQIKTIDVILELFNFKFEDFEKSYSRCFFKKIRDFELILNTFKDERLLHIIYYFCALVILNFNEKSNTEKTNLEEEIFTRIQGFYKLMVHRLVEKELGCFSISVFVGFMVMQCLIQSRFFEQKSESLELMNYCAELVHYKLNGFRLNSNALSRCVEHHFGKFYQMKTKSRSVINISLPKPQFDIAEYGSVPLKNSTKLNEDETRERYLESKVSDLRKDYDGIVDDFVKLMKTFIEKKNSNVGVENKIPNFNDNVLNEGIYKKNGININSLGNAIQQTTANSKKNFFVSKIIRFFGFNKRSEHKRTKGQQSRRQFWK